MTFLWWQFRNRYLNHQSLKLSWQKICANLSEFSELKVPLFGCVLIRSSGYTCWDMLSGPEAPSQHGSSPLNHSAWRPVACLKGCVRGRPVIYGRPHWDMRKYGLSYSIQIMSSRVWVHHRLAISLKIEGSHEANFVISGGTTGCHNDNLWCQHDDGGSMLTLGFPWQIFVVATAWQIVTRLENKC